jgi:hypothetical protein
MRKAIMLDVDGNLSAIDLDAGNGLKILQDAVGGWVQAVDFRDDLTIWVNEEGKLNNLPINAEATKIWAHFFGNTDFIVGNAVFTGGTDENGETMAISADAETFIYQQVESSKYLV